MPFPFYSTAISGITKCWFSTAELSRARPRHADAFFRVLGYAPRFPQDVKETNVPLQRVSMQPFDGHAAAADSGGGIKITGGAHIRLDRVLPGMKNSLLPVSWRRLHPNWHIMRSVIFT